MPPFKDESVLLIAPGSQTTAAQLGLPESFTPPRWRFPSRMFRGPREGEWEPVKIKTRIRRKEVPKSNASASANTDANGGATGGANGDAKDTTDNQDVEMSDAPAPADPAAENSAANGGAVQPATSANIEPDQPVQHTESAQNGNGSGNGSAPAAAAKTEATTTTIEEESFEADPYDEEGAVYPIVEGRIENWSCFFALLSYIHKVLSPHFHSPLLMVAQPAWSARDKEIITQFVFENWKVPAFCMFDAALAATYAYSTPSALVVDVGLDKCDVTAVTEFVVNEDGRAVSLKDAGGSALTKRLLQVLQSKGFDEAMAEQFKKSPVCEILPPGAPLPSEQAPAHAPAPAAAAAAAPAPAATAGATAGDAPATTTTTTTATTAEAPGSATDPKPTDGQSADQALPPAGTGTGTGTGAVPAAANGNVIAADIGEDNEEENEGVLDVAAIVARDNAAEILAKREAEKAAKATAKKGGVAEAPKAVRLKNSERASAIFTYEEVVPATDANDAAADAGAGAGAAAAAAAAANADSSQPSSRKRKREIEVGLERFMAATPLEGDAEGILERIAAAVHRTALAVHDPTQRPALWDNLIVLGNGARTKGFTQALISTLSSRFTLSPSTGTIFTSELPSNFTTPVATPGTNTPVPGHPPHPMNHPASHGVNPLLVAATRNVMQPHPGQQQAGQQPPQTPHNMQQAPGSHTPLSDPSAAHHLDRSLHRGFSQSPTTIKTAKAPEYFPEWKDPAVAGMEEAAFLGAQVAAKVVFITDQGASKGFMTRTEYNDVGPSGIHECAL